MAKIPRNLEKVALILADRLRGKRYAIRGTTSLVLQSLEMNVDDIDIVSDKEAALACNDLLKDYLVKKVKYQKSEKFKSYFGKFEINRVPVEVMGEWEIRIQNPRLKDEKWQGPFNATDRKRLMVNNKIVYVTTIKTELTMFAAMGRWNAYWKIKKQLPLDKQSPLF